MAQPVKLVFYDLEWSQTEIIQIGAVCGGFEFSQCVRPSGRIDPFVRKKIKLDVRDGPSGDRQVFDIERRIFLHTLDAREGFVEFLNWLENVSEGGKVMMISHGNADILVLDRNFSKFDLEERLYKYVSKYVDFQEYLAVHFKDISFRMSLKDLVGIFCKEQGFRLHCADEDSRALKHVFMNLHHMRGVDRATFERNLGKMRRIYMKSVTVPKSCKEIKELANKLNPGSQYVLLPNIFGVYNIFASSPLYSVLEPPENYQFEVPGYSIKHSTERYMARDEYKERTKIELACHIGNAYFILSHHIPANVKNPLNLVKKTGKKIILKPGTPVSVTVLVTSTNYVKVVEIAVNHEKKVVNVEKILSDLHKLKRGEKLEVCPEFRQCEQGSQGAGVDTNGNLNAVRGKSGLLKFGQPSGQKHDKNDVETDKDILARREKQLEYCKKTDDYKAYIDAVPKNNRVDKMPRTPIMTRKYSRRQWDGAVKHWKTQVHTIGREIIRSRRGKENENYGSTIVGDSKENVEEKSVKNLVTIVSDSDTQEINEKI